MDKFIYFILFFFIFNIFHLFPNRELALQIHSDCKKFCKKLELHSACVYGGVGVPQQVREGERGGERRGERGESPGRVFL